MTNVTQIATVKSILSSDTLVLRSKILGDGILPKERVLHLSGLDSCPRMGNRDKQDEPFSFEAREFLRVLLVGKEVKFIVLHQTSTAEFGSAIYRNSSGEELDVALEIVRHGWAKVRDVGNKVGDETEEFKRQEMLIAEDEAKISLRGLWNVNEEITRSINYNMPSDPVEFLNQFKGNPLDCVVEAVINGSSIRARLLLSKHHHQIVTLGIAGIRAPRATGLGENGTAGEEFGDDAKYFVETRLLQRQIKVTLLALPTIPIAPSSFNSSSAPIAPPPPSFFIGTVQHPAGNIAALLTSQGLARLVDWHAGFLSQNPSSATMMTELRKAESEAKLNRRSIWRNLPIQTPQGAAAVSQREKERNWNGIVVRILGADMLSVLKNGDGKEYKLQLASVRQPRASDPNLAGYQAEGKELLRKKMIGRPVAVTIDYVKAAEGEYSAKECCTIKTQSGANVAEMLVAKGLLSVIRHRSGDDQKSSDYDRLLAAEAQAIAATKGIHSGKESIVPRMIDASESAQKATPFLSSFKRAGRTPAVVDFVASGSRFKITVPKQDLKLTMILSGIRTPRTARNPSEKSEPFGIESASFITKLVLQRDVEVLIDATDKTGGFLGKMYLGNDNLAVLLLKEGLAKLDEYATVSRELTEAQDEAKAAKKNIWKEYDAEADAAAKGVVAAPAAARREYVDLVVSDVRSAPFSFAVQILSPSGGIPALEALMGELQQQYKSDVAPANFVPRSNDLVAAQFTEDNAWYRGKLRRVNPAKKEAEILYIDYGNTEIIPFSRLRPLTPSFKTLDGQAKEATLSFISLLGSETEYGIDSLELFRELCEGRQLVANIDARDTNLLHLSLFDPSDPSASTSHEASINVTLVREGLARIDSKSRFRNAYPSVVKALDDAVREAKRSRLGAYELGDIFED